VYVWKCFQPEACRLWSDSLAHMRKWMETQHTDPDMVEVLIKYLNVRRNFTLVEGTVPAYLQAAVDDQ
jgi:hypothetical protein